MKPTPAQEATLRLRPHKSKTYLSIYQPSTLYSCQITGTYAFGATEITPYNASGDINLTYANQTVLIGTDAGADDVGRIRLRNSTGTSLLFAENNIIWESGQHLTFIDYINVEAIFPKIITDPNNSENVIFYKDDDIAYTNQNTNYGTFVNMGSHRAAHLDGGTATLNWGSSGTYNVKGDTVSYNWLFEGGTPTGSSSAYPGNVVYNTPGHYKTRLNVTSSSGVVDTSYRYVSIYDKLGEGDNTPIVKWRLNNFSGSRGEGGYTLNIRVWQDLGRIEPNALVVLFSDDYYGSTNQSIGAGDPKIFFVGYILKNSIQFNWREGWADFDIGSVTEVMKEAEGFSVSCESKVSASTWFELTDMTVQKALYHYLRWHSTVLNITDFQYTGDDRKVQYFDSDRGSLYDAINSFVTQGLFGEVVSNRQGKIWAEISPIGYTDPLNSIEDGMTIRKQDWTGEPDISQRRTAQVSFVEMGGIVYQGPSTNGFEALLTTAPSLTPLYRGKSDSPRQGLILTGQTQLNKISGNYLAANNSKFEDVSLVLSGNYKNYDIAPQEKIQLLIEAQDTVINQSLIGYYFRINEMNWSINHEQDSAYADITFEQIATGTSGQTLIIPPTIDDGGYSYPSLELPPYPSFPSTPVVQQSSTTVLMVEDTGGLFYTTDFDSAQPTWFLWNNGIASADVSNIYYFPGGGSTEPGVFITPNGAVYVAIRGTASASGAWGKIYRAPYIGGQFSLIIDSTFLNAVYPGQIGQIQGFGYNPTEDEEVAFITGYGVGFETDLTKNMFIGNYAGFQKKADFIARSASIGTQITFGSNEWVWNIYRAASEDWVIFNPNGDKIADGTDLPQGYGTWHRHAGDTKIIVKKIGLAKLFARSTDNGRTYTSIDLSPDTMTGNYDITPNGNWLMGSWSTANKGRSADGGYSWQAVPALTPGGDYFYSYCGGEGSLSKWIAARGAIYYSDDFGNSWTQKTGNLLELFPPPGGAAIVKVVAYLETSNG